jgi:hypothetical protein
MKPGKPERILFGFIILLIGVFMLIQFGLNFLDLKTYIGNSHGFRSIFNS